MLHPQIARFAELKFPVDPGANGDRPDVVTLTNLSGHKLAGWVFASPTNHGVVLVGDGNATGIAQTYLYNRHLLRQGFNVVVLSYQGYDAIGGRASLSSLSWDIKQFYTFCKNRFPKQPIALVGESLSAGTFFCFGSRHPDVACMVLEGVVDLKHVAFTQVNESCLLRVLYPISAPFALIISATVPSDLNARSALRLNPAVPALFIHHPRDPVTPYTDARRIFENYTGPKEFIVPNLDEHRGFHMTGYSDLAVREKVLSFLRRYLSR